MTRMKPEVLDQRYSDSKGLEKGKGKRNLKTTV